MDNSQELTEKQIQELAKAAQNGDKDSFGHIYDHFVDSIYRYIYFRVPNHEVEDLLETVFLKAWENISQYNSEKAAFKSWLFRIAHNLVVDFYRLNRNIEALTDVYKDERKERNPLNRTESVINSRVLADAMSKLKKSYSQFLVLKFVNDLSNSEIAAILKKSEGSLRIIQFRALRQLKKVLAEMGIESL